MRRDQNGRLRCGTLRPSLAAFPLVGHGLTGRADLCGELLLTEAEPPPQSEADAKGVYQDRVRIKISGSGTVTAQGTTDDLDLSISGSGGYRGDALKSKTAIVGISGSDTAAVAAGQKLDVNVGGSGSIEYMGDPQVTQHISRSGSVRRR